MRRLDQVKYRIDKNLESGKMFDKPDDTHEENIYMSGAVDALDNPCQRQSDREEQDV